jgi:hypothetical protein
LYSIQFFKSNKLHLFFRIVRFQFRIIKGVIYEYVN